MMTATILKAKETQDKHSHIHTKQKAVEHKLKSHTNQIAWVCGEFI